MSILSDEYTIRYTPKKSDSASDDINPDQLRSIWINYCNMNKRDRIRFDEQCYEKYGKHFQAFYEDGIDKSTNIVIEAMEQEVEPTYNEADSREAINWSNSSNIPLIYPTATLEDLESLWRNWNTFPKRIRLKSDTASMRFFGIRNKDHYKYLKDKFTSGGSVNDYIEEGFAYIGDPLKAHQRFVCNQNINHLDRVKDLLTLLAKKNEAYDDVIVSTSVDKAINAHQSETQDIQYDLIPFEDLPFYTPEELVDFGVSCDNPEGNYYGCMPATDVVSEEDMKQWLKEYTNCFNGFTEGYNPVKWKNMIARLFLKRSIAENVEPYNQAILNLGWPPEAEFSPENQVKASKRIKMLSKDFNGSSQIVDISGFKDEENITIDESVQDTLKPVFIILMSGKSLFSKSIKLVTKSEYSHAAISFDPKLEKMVSYGVEGSVKGVIGGLIQENIKTKQPDLKFCVFTIFLKDKDWKKLKKNVDFMVNNVGKTTYSYLNLIVSHLFRIPLEFDKTMVCSQFVDKMMKLVDIDITKMNSSLVSPVTIERASRENKKVYKLFEGACKRYNHTKIFQKIQLLLKKAKPIKENINITNSLDIIFEMTDNIYSLSALQELSTKVDVNKLDRRVRRIYETMILPCLEAECYTEAKESPVQMDKYGNVFLNNIKKRNYETEYQMSHKLLKEYEKSGNIEGMKYELARIWAMQCMIEEKIHSEKFMSMDLQERNKTPEMKLYPKLVNDMQYYLGIVMREDPKFNFSKYYEKTQFNSDNIKIGHNTLVWSGKYLKAILTGI